MLDRALHWCIFRAETAAHCPENALNFVDNGNRKVGSVAASIQTFSGCNRRARFEI